MHNPNSFCLVFDSQECNQMKPNHLPVVPFCNHCLCNWQNLTKVCCVKFDPKKSISQSRVAWVGAIRFTFNFQSVSMRTLFQTNQCCLHHKNRHFPNFGTSERHTYRFHELQDGTMHDQMLTPSPALDLAIPKLFPLIAVTLNLIQINRCYNNNIQDCNNLLNLDFYATNPPADVFLLGLATFTWNVSYLRFAFADRRPLCRQLTQAASNRKKTK